MCMSRANGWINTDLAPRKKDRCDRWSEANERQTRPDCRPASAYSDREQVREGKDTSTQTERFQKTVLRCVPGDTYTLPAGYGVKESFDVVVREEVHRQGGVSTPEGKN